MQQGCLLQEPAWLPLESGYGVEHVKPMALVVDGQLRKERGEFGAQQPGGGCALRGSHPGRRVPPELADPVQGRCGQSSPSVSGRPQRSLRRSRSKKFRPPSNCTSSTCKPDATWTSAPGCSCAFCCPSHVRMAAALGSRITIRDCSGKPSGRRLLGGPEQGAVAADADDQAGAVKGIDQGARALLRRRAVGPDPITALLEPAARLHHRRAADVDPGMADDADGLSHSASDTTGIRGYPWRPGLRKTSRLSPGIQATGQYR